MDAFKGGDSKVGVSAAMVLAVQSNWQLRRSVDLTTYIDLLNVPGVHLMEVLIRKLKKDLGDDRL